MALKFRHKKSHTARRKPHNFENSSLFRTCKEQLVEEISQVMEIQQVSRLILAQRLESEPSAVTQILKPNRGLQFTTIVRIADALNCDLEINLILRGAAQQTALG